MSESSHHICYLCGRSYLDQGAATECCSHRFDEDGEPEIVGRPIKENGDPVEGWPP